MSRSIADDLDPLWSAHRSVTHSVHGRTLQS
jgi:hypothetical protein